jgi:protein-S-isoprenylcysteine O-methyltransferase Ste14
VSPVLRTVIFTVIAPGFWTLLMPYWLLPRGARPNLNGFGPLGVLLILCGAALYAVTAFWGFAIRGQGTPAPIDPPKKLVVDGPYGFVRNPMYWSVTLAILGEAVIFRSISLAELGAFFFAGSVLFVLLYEEPALRRKFGADYEAYCRRVPRWLPQLGPRSRQS